MQLTAAAAGLCELLWMIDGSLPEMREMTELLNRFGPVVDVAGLSVEQILEELSPPYKPDGIVTYLDANMATYARGGRNALVYPSIRPRPPRPDG